MAELIFETFIGRDVEFVFDNLYKREVFRKWASAFSPDPKYIGVISKGNTVKFGDEDNNLTCIVSSYIENKEIIFSYTEQNMQGVKTKAAGMSEEYDFTIANAETTVLTVKLNVPEQWEEMMKEMWEKAIVLIKQTLEEL